MSSSSTAPRASDPSWWLSEALAREGNVAPQPPLGGRVEADVAIVGGGFAGLWTAKTLKERSPALRIVLIEADICGSGASAKNGGMVSGYTARFGPLAADLGVDAARHVVRNGVAGQGIIRDFARSNGEDLWFTEAGTLRVSVHPSHDARIDRWLADDERFGLGWNARRLNADELGARCKSPLFRGALHSPDSGNIHPGRLVRALRRAVLALGVTIHEQTRFLGLDRGTPNRVRATGGEIIAREVVLAMNTGLTIFPELRRHISMLSSYVLMTEPVPDRIAAMNWHGQEGLTDLRSFLRYARKTPDGRVLFGWTGGPVGYRDHYRSLTLREDPGGAQAVVAGMHALLPALRGAPVAKIWGGGVDVSSDRLPFFKTFPGTRIHYAGGFSGHGVNATCIAGQCLASLVLNEVDEWSTSPLVTRELPRLPPEPFRYLGARGIRWGLLACENAREAGQRASWPARFMAALPQTIGLKLGTR